MALPALPGESELLLLTDRIVLEPITIGHAEELRGLFADEELHRFLPSEPMSLEDQRAQCAKWENRRSLDGNELWLNWAARHRESHELIGHFQVGVHEGGMASLAYLVARRYQRNGLATEAVRSVIAFARENLQIVELKAWIDTRNRASVAFIERLGLRQVALIEDADHFKGAQSDEYVFALRWPPA